MICGMPTSVKHFDEIPFPQGEQLPAFPVKVYQNNYNNGKICFQKSCSGGKWIKLFLSTGEVASANMDSLFNTSSASFVL